MEKKRGGYVPGEVENAAIDAWAIGQLAAFFADFDNLKIIETDEDRKKFVQAIERGSVRAAAAINAFRRGLTVTEYLRMIQEADTQSRFLKDLHDDK